MWGKIPTITMSEIGEENTIGHDLWYENETSLIWTKLQNSIISLNMAAWGTDLDRWILWKNMARTKTMVAVLQDHRRTYQQQHNMQYEVEETLLGGRTGREVA